MRFNEKQVIKKSFNNSFINKMSGVTRAEQNNLIIIALCALVLLLHRAASTKSAGFRLPILQGVCCLSRAQVPIEPVAGLTLAALAIPEVMGYTKIAGTPVIYGLYTVLISMAREST